MKDFTRGEGLREDGLAAKVEYRFDLLDPCAIMEMAKVMQEGLDTGHDADGWRKMEVNDIINHAQGHLIKHMMGEKDEDHLAHAMVRTMMAWSVNHSKKEQGTVPMVIYICHPYKDNPAHRTRTARNAASLLWKAYREYCPLILVPHLMFGFMDEETQRKDIMEMCLKAVDVCTLFVILGKHVSDGMEEEIERAQKLGKMIVEVDDIHARDLADKEIGI